jgi:hypothetical protein
MRTRAGWALWLVATGCGGEAHFRPPGVDAGPGEDAAAPHDAAPDASLDAGVDSGCHDDVDEDGVDSPECGGRDCDDHDPTIRPRAEDPGEWLFERADELGWAVVPAVAVGADGIPHVLFEDRSAHAVVHAVRVGEEEWSRQVVEDGGRSPGAAVDADGQVHVVFVAATADPPALRHAVLSDGGAWDVETAVAGAANHEPLRPALVAGAEGALVAAFVDVGPDGGAVRLAIGDGGDGAWAVEDVATGGGAAELADGPAALALGPDGTPWLAWERAEVIHVADRLGGAWTVEPLALPAAAAPCIGVGPAGEVIVGTFDREARSMVVARRGASAWTTETVDDRDGAGAASAIAFDAAGVVHLVYHAPGRFDTRWATDAYGDWLRVTMDRSSESDLALTIDPTDPTGAVQMAYGTSDSDLRWSRHVMGDGIDQDCDGLIDGG